MITTYVITTIAIYAYCRLQGTMNYSNKSYIYCGEILSVFNSVSLEANDIKMAEHLGIKTKIHYT